MISLMSFMSQAQQINHLTSVKLTVSTLDRVSDQYKCITLILSEHNVRSR